MQSNTHHGASAPMGDKELLVKIVLDEATLFHTPPCPEVHAPREPYAVVREDERERIRHIEGKPFRLWLTQRFWEHTHRVPAQTDMRDVVILLKALALDGEESDILIRWIGGDNGPGERPLTDAC